MSQDGKLVVRPSDTRATTEPVSKPVPIKRSDHAVQDACFDGLMQKYIKEEDFDFATLLGVIWDKVIADRERERL